jgi:SecD/SecF fusion protein
MRIGRGAVLLGMLIGVGVAICGALLAWHAYLSRLVPTMERNGGTALVYELDEATPLADYQPEEMAAAVQRRVNPSDVNYVKARPAGDNRIEILIPRWGEHEEHVRQVKDLVAQVGVLEFRILANQADESDVYDSARLYFQEAKTDPKIRADLDRRALAGLPPPSPPLQNEAGLVTAKGRFKYSWIELAPSCVADQGFDSAAADEHEENALRAEGARRAAEGREHDTVFVCVDRLYYARKMPVERRASRDYEYFVLARDNEEGKDNPGRYVNTALAQANDQAVRFSLRPPGDTLMGELSGNNIDRPMAIVLDERVMSVANIRSKLASEGQITGTFTKTQLEDLATLLRSGPLPAKLKPVPVAEVEVAPGGGK